jgi:predicted nucleotide-binding protein
MKSEDRIIDILQHRIEVAERILEKGEVKPGQLKMWTGSVMHNLKLVYGDVKNIAVLWHPERMQTDRSSLDELVHRKDLLVKYLANLQLIGENIYSNDNTESRIFIGHGQSPIWRELKDFVFHRLDLPWDEFNREPIAGITTTERLNEMISSAMFAFLIMTAEDEQPDDSIRARQNVVHEAGLFQGKLGLRKAIILLEDGCSEFSNIYGLSQIRFPRGKISASFEEVRMVLEREGIVKS